MVKSKQENDDTCEYGNFNIDPDWCFVKTHQTLACYIVKEYIRENIRTRKAVQRCFIITR